MTTSYTSNLGLAKPATGDTGWGTTINDSTTTMIEEAIAGKATINTWPANSHTLTENNGASSEARAAILHCTDTGGVISVSTANVIVPAKNKLYCVMNETGHNVLVKTSSGTGVSVPTATIMNVVCDGTNVKEQDNHSVSFSAGSATVSGQVTAEILKIDSTSSISITGITDEDDMATDSANRLATQQSIKAYADQTGAIRRTEIIKPWTNSETITGDALPYQICGDNATVTIAEFDVHGNSRTVAQELDLNINGQLIRTGFGSDSYAQKISAWVVVSRSSKSATGTSLGNVAVTDTPASGDATSYYKKVEVSGDKTHLIDSFTSIAADASGTNAKPITNATYNDTTDRTSIYYDSGLGATGLFGSTSQTVYVSASRFSSPGTYAIANPENVAKLYSLADMLTFDISEYVAPTGAGSDNIVTTRKSIQLPKLRLAPNGTAGDVTVRVQIMAGRADLEGVYHFYSLQVDQTNITRPV